VLLRAGRLSSGFVWPEAGLVAVSEPELFGTTTRRRSSSRPKGRALADLGQLKPDDFVVHEVHGVGRYMGLVREVVAGVPADFMAIHYAGTDKLFVPVHRFSVVRRYLAGSPDYKPPLDRLGGVTWQRRKGKVTDLVRRLAEQLLQVQAQRASLPGHAFPDGGELMAAFEASFPYEETEDQLRAIEATVEDMQTGRPMDRLVCGDVGYGKTEVAMRAALLAVLGGRQVAVLVPTTVLVEQHLSTFSRRMDALPVQVAGLSRFTSKQQQKQILAGLADGIVDLVVGTHRLLSSDVRFRSLGLVVIDEEQRFGVAHKERLKELRSQVDVLSLTATPIPRTLQMAMVGLRELSVITTPPADRLAVRTFVCGYSPATLSEAIRFELARGGQVFVVVPRIGQDEPDRGAGGKAEVEARSKQRRRGRGKGATAGSMAGGRGQKGTGRARARGVVGRRVEGIEYWAEKVQSWAGGASVGVAHGRMDSRALERVMVDFVSGRHQVLVSTSIVESGLDIPNANTMIVMHADLFGMAQLYQLRGRVGRGSRQAFCYFVVDSIQGLTKQAGKRLSALERLSGLGAAFNLATEDLEIRGAGDILGQRQSGQVSAVGFDTYVELLHEAVAELRNETVAPHRKDCDLQHDLPAFLPDDWVAEPGQRLHYYQRLSLAGSEDEVSDVMAELEDLFGLPVPSPAELLADLTSLRITAETVGAERLELSGATMILNLTEDTPLDPEAVLKLVVNDHTYRLTPQHQLIKKLSTVNDMQRIEEARNGLQRLVACVRPCK